MSSGNESTVSACAPIHTQTSDIQSAILELCMRMKYEQDARLAK